MNFEAQSAMTVVSLTLLPDGRVLKSYIEETSGDPQFDQSVMRAILKSTPFPPPPIGLKQQRFDLGLRFHSTPQAP
jgi:TonB family protein